MDEAIHGNKKAKNKQLVPSYNSAAIEKYWQEVWDKEKTYQIDLDTAKKPFYNLMMFPYPSAEGLHVGNVYAFGGIDAYGRFKRMQGYEVFQPIGLDGFGIHSENYAIKVGRTPQVHAQISEKHFYEQLQMIGNGYSWKNKVETYKPEYYKWTQWLFIELFKAGLAYKAKASVNFCPSCKTVLSDEQVIDGKCERCNSIVVKRELEQWFFRITDYAQRLLTNTEKLDWTEKVKTAQINWIGKKKGTEIEFRVQNSEFRINVFTTRPDTLYGVTYLVVNPEHEIVSKILNSDSDEESLNINEIKAYVSRAKKSSIKLHQAEGKEKTGVFSGFYAINPVNNEQIPIWIADYVLTEYGTGAIMAVPAHDQRDFEFAKKYSLPIKQVIAPETGFKRENETVVYGGCGVIFDPKTQKYAVSKHPDGLVRLFAGGVNENEELEKGVLREVEEESGLCDFSYKEKIQTIFTHFYNKRKKLNRAGWATCYLFILNSDKTGNKKLEPHELELTLEWMDAESILSNWQKNNTEKDVEHWILFLKQAVGRNIELGFDKTSNPEIFKDSAYIGDGIIINSGEWDDWRVPESIDKVTSWLEEKKIGKSSVNFHLRDWLISRQRYWGPPIPMIFCQSCADQEKSWFTTQVQSSKFKVQSSAWKADGWYPVSEDQLPLLLPVVEDFKPLGTHSAGSGQAGNAPLARHPEFFETTCPECGSDAVRETDVSDTFLDSSWYFFRYLATDRNDLPMPIVDTENRVKNNKKLNQRLKWLPVASYIGGAEHAVLHLLYSRFITMVLNDLGYIGFEEPFVRFRAHGLIIKDGAKMSKSKGNVINPDEYVKKFGADTLRTYLSFIGPFTQGGDFQDAGIEGINRFLKRVWKFVLSKIDSVGKDEIAGDKEVMMHKTIKGVTEDMEELRFNTAIAKIMTYYNFLSDQKTILMTELNVLLKLIAPFAPHMTEELWQRMVIKKENSTKFQSIHVESWPYYDTDKIVSDIVTIAVQVNGKLRDTLKLSVTDSQSQVVVERLVKESEKMNRLLEGKTIRKVIYVPGKIINFVI